MPNAYKKIALVFIFFYTFLFTACRAYLSRTCDMEPGPFSDVSLLGNQKHFGPKMPRMMELGRDLDHLENHIDWFGFAIPKVPDVWGQARLTVYREQFEEEMAAERKTFAAGLQGSLARSDQAFLANANALSMAVQPKAPVVGRVATVQQTPGLVLTSREVVVVSEEGTKTGDSQKTEKSTTTTKEGQPTPPTPSPKPDPIKPLDLTDVANEVGSLKEMIKRSDAKLDRIGFDKKLKDGGVGLEPTLVLAQKKRYLDFLNQLRRENEGDDTADSPGYSLNLVRVPVSIFPGRRTGVGYGAEVTMTLTPVLGDDLLPATFRRFIINDLVHQLGFPMALFLDDQRQASPDERFLTTQVQDYLQALEANNLAGTNFNLLSPQSNSSPDGRNPIPSTANLLATQETVRKVINRSGLNSYDPDQKGMTKWFSKQVMVPRLSFSNALNARTPFPTSQILDVYGLRFTFEPAFAAFEALGKEGEKVGYIHLPDLQSYLREELIAAYQFLAHPENRYLWDQFCTEQLVAAIRSQRWEELLDMRRKYRDEVMKLTNSKPLYAILANGKPDLNQDGSARVTPVKETRQVSVTSALAWCILVDAALLTDRLMQDMKETASAKNKALPGCDHWHPFFLPDPPAECRQAFNAYVAMRWPVHVFALDPYTQDQNIADALSTRRETQLALSIAFTNGQINARTMTRYARRLEAEYEAIALNRTQIGFSHGENVFGWRFYPRFQSPDTPSNAEALLREQIVGGPTKNQLLRDRSLEPGPRECVAVVMMPSFVPYAELDSVTTWFQLDNPKNKVLDHSQALRLSRTIQRIKRDGFGVTDASDFRDGEFQRLLRRAEQLEARLPTQTVVTPIPLLNTLGGFEMFSNGTTDLAPELLGWYGAPGVNRDTETVLFLVGDHFSPLRTEVVAGNKVAGLKLLSRQVVQITIPAGSIPLQESEIRVHLATPYGVTRELSIPVINSNKKTSKKAEGYSFDEKNDKNKLSIEYKINSAQQDRFFPTFHKVTTSEIRLNWEDESGSVPKQIRLTFKFVFQGVPITIPCDSHIEVSATGRQFIIEKDKLTLIAKELVNRIAGSVGALPLTNNPLDKPLPAISVEVTPLSETHAVQPVKAANPIVVQFIPEATCQPGALLPPPSPEKRP